MSDSTKRAAFACAEFLAKCCKDGSVKADDQEGLETAIQIIEEAFGIDTNDAKQVEGYSLKPASLQQILDVYSKTKSGSKGAASNSASASASASGSTSNTASTSTPNARDKAAAEDAKSKGNTLMSSKDYDGAIAAYTQAIEKDAANPVYYSNRAAAYSQINKHDKAIADARKAAEVDPSFSKAYSRLGHALYCSGQYAESVQAYEKGLELDPTNQTMKNSLNTARSKVPAEQDDDEDEDRDGDVAAPGGGGNPFAGMGGAGGMPDIAAMMNNPMIAQMAQGLMANGGLESLMQNPALRSMAENFQRGGGMPDMSTLSVFLFEKCQLAEIKVNNPQLRQMAEQFGAGRGAGRGAGANNNNDNMYS